MYGYRYELILVWVSPVRRLSGLQTRSHETRLYSHSRTTKNSGNKVRHNSSWSAPCVSTWIDQYYNTLSFLLLQSTIRKATTQNANLVGHLRKSNRLSIKQIQQSLAEYKFSQSTDFIYRRVPEIAWNILRKVSLQFTAIFYLHLHPYSSLAKTWFLYQTGFGPGFKFSTSHFICVLNLNILLLILSERKNLDFEGRTWKWHVAFSPSMVWRLLSRPIRR